MNTTQIKRVVTFGVIVLFISAPAIAQLDIKDAIRELNSYIATKDIDKYKKKFFQIMIVQVGTEDVIDRPFYGPIILSRKDRLNDLKKVKFKKEGSYKNLYDFFLQRIINDSLGIRRIDQYRVEKKKEEVYCFDCAESLRIINKNKSKLESVKDVSVFEVNYPFMNFFIYVNKDDWRIIITDTFFQFDQEIQIEFEKEVYYLYRGSNMSIL